jgi:hypothetical protein
MNDLVAGLTVLLALAGIAAFAVLRTRRLMRDDGRLRLPEVLRGQGLVPAPVDGDAGARALGIATRRCVACAHHARCDALLAARDWQRLVEICPNRAYFDALHAR